MNIQQVTREVNECLGSPVETVTGQSRDFILKSSLHGALTFFYSDAESVKHHAASLNRNA